MKKCKWLLISISIIFFLIVNLSACKFSKPTMQDIVGIWIETDRTCEDATSFACGRFEFFSNGLFIASSIPREFFILPRQSSPRIDATGNWTLDTHSLDPFAVHQIDLVFDPIEGFPLGFTSSLNITVGGGMIFQGLDGNEILFTKQDVNR